MSDLLSPILYVMENEVDAFWCFALYMAQMVKKILILIFLFLVSELLTVSSVLKVFY